MPDRIVPVILAGGLGTRLWPMSRTERPKQFLQLIGEGSLYQQTLRRVAGERYAPPVVLTNADYRFLVAEQAMEIGMTLGSVLLEPCPRSTAPAIVAAAHHIAETLGPDAVLLVLPSDHAIGDDDDYREALGRAETVARGGHLVTFGIRPTAPETGYGYIEIGEVVAPGANRVARFVEKPDLARAQELLATGRHLWNSGMFMLQASPLIEECARHAPDVNAAAGEAVTRAMRDLDFTRLDAEAFARAPSISIDYAIFERTDRSVVVPVSFGWSDLGSWDAVWRASPQDGDHNAALGPATLNETSGSLVVSDGARVVLDGLDDVAVIASDDAIYVGQLSRAQQVGALATRLAGNADTAALTSRHRTTYRPWGGYSSILSGERFQVKRLFVKPGCQLSLQRHHHRSEHWVVVRGTAQVTVDGRIMQVTENESVYLPVGCAHRLANPGKMQLELIEVQTGSYLGEDDIVRIEDDFGRT